MTGNRSQTYWIMAPDQLAAMASARRQDIVDRLAATGPLSVKELAAQIGARPPALYHHLERLLAVGLIEEAGSRIVRRKREQLYATRAPRMRMARALAEGAHPALMEAIVASLTRQMDRDFRAGTASPARRADGEQRNFGFFRLIGRPDAAGMARINSCLGEVAEILWQADDADADLVCLSWVLAPL
ncbi:MAG TPA: helix-turn-helix domain-containing protein [Allosphingosinicella sp.]|nr:helix-turn-helix domain-containing protein [Allosphingosinicella sp.]